MPSPSFSVTWFLRMVLPGFLIATSTWIYLAVFLDVPPLKADAVWLSVYAFSGVFIGFMIDASDPLLHGRRLHASERDFFRAQLPSNCLIETCKQCSGTCYQWRGGQER